MTAADIDSELLDVFVRRSADPGSIKSDDLDDDLLHLLQDKQKDIPQVYQPLRVPKGPISLKPEALEFGLAMPVILPNTSGYESGMMSDNPLERALQFGKPIQQSGSDIPAVVANPAEMSPYSDFATYANAIENSPDDQKRANYLQDKMTLLEDAYKQAVDDADGDLNNERVQQIASALREVSQIPWYTDDPVVQSYNKDFLVRDGQGNIVHGEPAKQEEIRKHNKAVRDVRSGKTRLVVGDTAGGAYTNYERAFRAIGGNPDWGLREVVANGWEDPSSLETFLTGLLMVGGAPMMSGKLAYKAGEGVALKTGSVFSGKVVEALAHIGGGFAEFTATSQGVPRAIETLNPGEIPLAAYHGVSGVGQSIGKLATAVVSDDYSAIDAGDVTNYLFVSLGTWASMKSKGPKGKTGETLSQAMKSRVENIDEIVRNAPDDALYEVAAKVKDSKMPYDAKVELLKKIGDEQRQRQARAENPIEPLDPLRPERPTTPAEPRQLEARPATEEVPATAPEPPMVAEQPAPEVPAAIESKPVEVASEVKAADTADLAEASDQLGEVANDSSIDQDTRDAVAFIKDSIDGELQARGETATPVKMGKREAKLLTKLGIISPETATVTVSEANAAVFKAQQKAADKAYRAARKEVIAEYRQKIADLQAEWRAKSDKLKATANEEKNAIKSDAREKKIVIRTIRDELRKAIVEKLPYGSREALMTQLAKVETARQFEKALDRIDEVLAGIEQKASQTRLKRAYNAINLNEIAPEYRSEVKKVLSGIQDTRLPPQKRAELEATRAMLQANPNARVSNRTRKEIERLDKKAIGDMTAEEADQISPVLEYAVAETKKQVKLAAARQAAMDKRNAVQMASELTDALKQRKVFSDQKQKKDRKPSILSMPFSATYNMEPFAVARALGKGEVSSLYNVLHKNIVDATDNHLGPFYRLIDGLKDKMDSLGVPTNSREAMSWSNVLAGKFLLRDVAGRAVTQLKLSRNYAESKPYTMADGTVVKMTDAEKMSILALLRDERNHDLILHDEAPLSIKGWPAGKTFKMTYDDMEMLQRSLTPEQTQVIDHIFKQINGPLRASLSDWSYGRYGTDRTVDYEYFPSERRYQEGEEPKPVDKSSLSDQVLTAMDVLKSRTQDATNPFVIEDIFGVFNRYAYEITGLTGLDPALTEARRALGSAEVNAALANSKGGDKIRYKFLTHYQAIIDDVVHNIPHRIWADTAVRWVLRNTTTAIIEANIPITLYQASSSVLLSRYINSAALTQAAAEIPFQRNAVLRRMYERNPQLRRRNTNNIGYLAAEGGFGSTEVAALTRRRLNAGVGIIYVDHTVIAQAGRAAEIEATWKGLTGDEWTEYVKALEFKAIMESQPTQDPMHVSTIAIEARTSGFARVMSLFRSQVQKLVGRIMEDFVRIPERGYFKGTARFGLTVLHFWLLTSVMVDLIRHIYNGFLTGDWKKQRDTFFGDVLSRAAGIFVGGDRIVYAMRKWFMSNGSWNPEPTNPVDSALVDIFNASKIISAKNDKQRTNAILDTASGLSSISGIPAVSAIRHIKALHNRMNAEELPRATQRGGKRRSISGG